ncbi:MAG: PH domain-containing protein [Oscillospiraceae bacterium]|nr:PH domain-containing protein [Oscillospiraceae bacterium]
MIDFENAKYLKLSPVENDSFAKLVQPILVPGEDVIQSFQTVRDGILFTTKRIITINIQGVIGKKKDFTSLPYSKIQAFSIESAGIFDLDNELELWFSGLGKIRFEFDAKANVAELCRIISEQVL